MHTCVAKADADEITRSAELITTKWQAAASNVAYEAAARSVRDRCDVIRGRYSSGI
jgi:hypothetical protein